MSYIISWSGNTGRIMIDDSIFDIFEKPEIDFAFDALYYETPTSLFIKILDGKTIDLTEEEKAACVKYCLEFKESDDFPVMALDPSYNLYMGVMSRGQARDRGLTTVEGKEIPSFTPAILEEDHWARVVYAITDKGKLVANPIEDHKSYVMLFTDKSWKTFLHPSNTEMTYDFKSETWVDGRDFNATLDKAVTQVRSEAVADMSSFDLLKTPVDPVLYLYQYNEVKKYEVDKNTATPFIDAVVATTGYSKESFIKRISNKYNEERLNALGIIHGTMIKRLDLLSHCETLSDIDLVMSDIEFTHTPLWLQPLE